MLVGKYLLLPQPSASLGRGQGLEQQPGVPVCRLVCSSRDGPAALGTAVEICGLLSRPVLLQIWPDAAKE